MIELNATFFAQIINFLVLVAVLKAFAYKPVAKMLQERSDKIAASIKKADEDQAQAAALLQENKDALAQARAEAQQIIDKADKRAAEERQASVQATRKEVEQMKETAKQEIEQERARVMSQMRGEVVSLSLAAASKIIAKNMDAAENEKLVSEFIDSLDKEKIGDLSC